MNAASAISASQFEGRSRADEAALVRIAAKDLNFYYGQFHSLKNINLDFHDRQVTALIVPSGCGRHHPTSRADGRTPAPPGPSSSQVRASQDRNGRPSWATVISSQTGRWMNSNIS